MGFMKCILIIFFGCLVIVVILVMEMEDVLVVKIVFFGVVLFNCWKIFNFRFIFLVVVFIIKFVLVIVVFILVLVFRWFSVVVLLFFEMCFLLRR